jgi:peptide/nickel transport system permease protein
VAISAIAAATADEELAPHVSLAQDAWRRFSRNPLALFGLAVVVVLVASAIFAPLIARYGPDTLDMHLIGTPTPPSAAHWFGTDVDGRDYFSRALFGARISLQVGFAAMIVAVSIGTLYGAISGFYGGKVDAGMMRFVDVMLSFPSFFLILSVEALTNQFSILVIMLVIGLLSWPGVSRLVRAQMLSLRERDFVVAATAEGANDARIILRHLLPNALAPVIVAATLAIGDNILTESGLSFLGLGVQIPTPSWGNMLQKALEPDTLSAPWLIAIPGLLIMTTVLAFNFIGEGLRDALDPRTKK